MISINIEKAKEIGHDIRRKQRDESFAPYDRIIELRIPGEDDAAAEAERAKIRIANETKKQEINNANSPEEIKQILGI